MGQVAAEDIAGIHEADGVGFAASSWETGLFGLVSFDGRPSVRVACRAAEAGMLGVSILV